RITFFMVDFFFQAEDGIRVRTVTGVQTCALPISRQRGTQRRRRHHRGAAARSGRARGFLRARLLAGALRDGTSGLERCRATESRSEERRVGKEWRSRWLAAP